MATDPSPRGDTPEQERRFGLRRARTGGGFGSGAMTRSESYRSEEDAEADDLNQRALQEMHRVPSLPGPTPVDDDPDESRRRLAEAVMAGDPGYAREFRLGLLNKLLLRGIALDAIAREMGVSISTVKNDRAELRRRFREQSQGLNIHELIGEQKAFYDETTALALRIVSQRGTPTPMRLAGIRTALAAKADQTRFLASAGVFDTIPFRKTQDGEDLSDVQLLMQRTEELLTRLADEEEGNPPPAASRPASRVLPRRPGSFKPLTFDDADASGSQNETQEI